MLLTKNSYIAKYNKFEEYYNMFKNSKLYKGANYLSLNTELFNEKISELGQVQNIIYRLLGLWKLITEESTPISKLVPPIYNKRIMLKDLSETIALFNDFQNAKNIKDLLTSLKRIEENNHELSMKILEFHEVDAIEIEQIFQYNFYKDEESIKKLLEMDIKELDNWYEYLTKSRLDSSVSYNTIHSSKGEEYDNVLVVLDDNFANKKITSLIILNL